MCGFDRRINSLFSAFRGALRGGRRQPLSDRGTRRRFVPRPRRNRARLILRRKPGWNRSRLIIVSLIIVVDCVAKGPFRPVSRKDWVDGRFQALLSGTNGLKKAATLCHFLADVETSARLQWAGVGGIIRGEGQTRLGRGRG